MVASGKDGGMCVAGFPESGAEPGSDKQRDRWP